MENEKWIWLDMDGTIADLYARDSWLEEILALDTTPYDVARLMYNHNELINIIKALKNSGYKVGVISWLSKKPNEDYDRLVTKAKKEWLKKHLLDVLLDEIIITRYGVRKADSCRKFGYGILVDDEEQNRCSWDLGETINANNNIIIELKALLIE